MRGGAELARGEVAPLPGNHVEALAVLAHQQRLNHADGGNRGGEAVDVPGAVLAHVELGHLEVGERNVLQVADHRSLLRQAAADCCAAGVCRPSR